MSHAHDMRKQCGFIWDHTFQCPVLRTIPYLSLPAALAAELFALHTALASVHAVLQRILHLGALFLFPVKNAKELINCVCFEPLLGQHSSFFHVAVNIKKVVLKYVSSIQITYLDHHSLDALY